MKSVWKSILCIALAALMLTGCSQTGQDGSSSVSEQRTTEDLQEQSSSVATDNGEVSFDENGVSPAGQFPIVEEPITISVMVPTQQSVEDLSTNDFTAWYEDLTNIHVEWNVVPSENASEKLNISLSSGDMPDIYANCGVTQSQQQIYGPQGAFIALNEYIEKYGENFQLMLDKVEGLEKMMTLTDGNIYSLPSVEKCVHCEGSNKLWVNKKWLDALDMELPTTVDEFTEMLRRFKEEDPNGNGKADEIPLLTFEGGWHTGALSGWLTNPFVYTTPDQNYMYVENGQIQLSYMQDGWRDAMTWLHQLYEEGLFYDQSLVINQDQARQLCAADGETSNVGCFPSGTPNTVPGDDASQWGDYVTLSPIEGPAGRLATYQPYTNVYSTELTITSACENPAAAFRWCVEQYSRDINVRKRYGVENENWKKIIPGEDGVSADAIDLNSGEPAEIETFIDGIGWSEQQNYCWRDVPGVRCDTPEVPELRYNRLNTGDYDTNNEIRIVEDTIDYMQDYYPDIDMCVMPLIYNEEQAATLANTETVVQSYVDEMAAAFITGTSDPEADWDAYLNELSVKGVDQLLEIYQAAYDARS